MSDTMEIIISAVDSASEVFQSIIGSVTSMGDSISDVIGMASSDFDSMAENVSGFQDAVSDIDSSSIEDLAEELGMSTDEVERLIDVGAGLGSIPFNDAAASADDLETEITETTEAMEQLNNSAGDVMVAQTFQDMAEGFAGSMMSMADSAGSFQDSVNRASLEAEGFGVSADEMKSVVNELSESTGRAGGQIRESFIKAAARGVTDMGSFKTMMEGASAQAYLFGTDVQTMANSFSSLATKSSVSEKFLANMGITMDELADAMGMTGATADEVKDKWKELDTNQRAAILGTAASMNEGESANEEYKNSWQGLQDQIEIAKGKLERIVGSVILPVVVPAMKVAGDILSGVGDVIDFVMKTPLGGLISVLGTAAGVFIIVATAVASLTTFLGFLRVGTMLETTATVFNTAAKILNGEAAGVGAIANALLGESFMASAAAAWTAAAGFLAASWPLLVIVGAIALVVVAIYELGKAFGWWTDVSSMIDAIKAGLQELWDAFINHPDVQAAIQVISDAWNSLSSAVSGAWNAVLDFFNINENGSFDIVQALIDGVGQAWNNLKNIIMPLINIFSTVLSVLWDLANGNISVVTAITAIWNSFAINIPVILNTIRNIFRTIWNSIKTVVSTLVRGMVNSVVSLLKGLASRAYSALMSVVNSIVSAGKSWVSNAISYGSQVVSGVINQITGLPGKIATEFGKIPGRINEAVSNAVSAAANFGDNIKNAVLNALHIASPGIIQRKIATEFKDTVTRIKDNIDSAYNAGRSFGKSIVDGVGSIDLNDGLSSELSTVDIGTGQAFDIRTGEYYEVDNNLEVTVKQEHEFVFSFKDVPEWIDTEQLLALIKKCMSDKTVIKELVSNPDFQALDNQVKTRILRKVNRSRGV